VKYLWKSLRRGRAVLAIAGFAVLLAPGVVTAGIFSGVLGWLGVRSLLRGFRGPIDAAERRAAWRQQEEERLRTLAGMSVASRRRSEALQLRIEALRRLRGGSDDPAEALLSLADAQEFAALQVRLLQGIDELDLCAPAAGGAGMVAAGRDAVEPLRLKRRAELEAQCRDAEQAVESLIDRAAVGSATGDVRLRLETLRNAPGFPGFSTDPDAERPRRAYEGNDH
jgi:signal transduction histidine kinase